MKHRPSFTTFLVLLCTLLLSACAPAMAPSQTSGMPEVSSPMQPGAEEKSMDSFQAERGNIVDASGNFLAPQRLVIRNANLSIVVPDPGKAMDEITRLAEELDGFVVTSNMYKTTTSEGVEIPQAEITIRVPAEKLTQTLAQIKALVEDPTVDILSENVSGQDVTQEYTDTKSRLTNLEAAEKQLQSIMDEAIKTEDVLAVYNQLVQVREQIEVLKGQIQYYEQSAALSAVSVNLRAQASVQQITIGGWRPEGVAREAVQTLIDTFQFLGSALIWLIIYIAPTGAVLVLFFLLLRFIWRKIFKPKPRAVPAPPTQPTQPPANPPALK
jgi:hypothetical protein